MNISKSFNIFIIVSIVFNPVYFSSFLFAENNDLLKKSSSIGQEIAKKSTNKFQTNPIDYVNSSKVNEIFDDQKINSISIDISNNEDVLKEKSNLTKILINPNNHDPNSESFKILNQTRKEHTKIDLSKDSIVQDTKTIYEDLNENLLADCPKKTKSVSKNGTKHIRKIKTCTVTEDFQKNCDINHSISTDPIITLVNGDYATNNLLNISPCENDDCINLWVGEYYGDSNNWCNEFVDHLYLKVNHPEAITKVELTHVSWDDYFAVFIDEHLLFNTTKTIPIKISDPTQTINFEAKYQLQQGKEYVYIDRLNNDRFIDDPNCENKGEDCNLHRCNNGLDVNIGTTVDGINLTRLFQSKTNKSDVIHLKTITSTADVGKYQANIRVYYDPQKLIIEDSWTPSNCVKTVQAIDDKFIEGDYECLEYFPINKKNKNCTNINGINICENYLSDFFAEKKISSLCSKVNVKTNRRYLNNEDVNDCKEFIENCNFISDKCVSDALGNNANCYEHELTYDCGENIDKSDQYEQTYWDCNSEFKCLGNECIENEKNVSSSFEKINALLNSVQFMGNDMECSGLDRNGHPTTDVNISCKVFSGTHKICKKALSGMGGLEVDCCKSPGGIAPSEYISALLMLPKLDSMIARLGPSNMIYGAYNYIREPIYNGISNISNSLSKITKPFSSWVENNLGITTVSDSKTVNNGLMEQFTDIIKKKAQEMIKKIIIRANASKYPEAGISAGELSNELQEQLEQQAMEQAQAIVEGLETCISVIGYVYMVYQIACMASQMMFKCNDDQLALAAQKQLGNCTYIGQYCSEKVSGICVEKAYSYCCYSSPLSRIIQEQIHNIQGNPLNLMDPKQPTCGGLSIDELSNIDWENLDLTEWTEILTITGNNIVENITSDTLTGSGSMLNIDYSESNGNKERKNIQERTVDRIFEIDFSRINQDTNNQTFIGE